MMIPKPPYPVFVLGFVINGFGLALQARVIVSCFFDRRFMRSVIRMLKQIVL